ncbi:metalloendopeptidase, partial [Trichonephila clavata]
AYHHFEKLPEDLVQTANVSYDYNSIMHYGSHRFSKNRGVPTIIPLKKNVTIGQRKGLSKSDILKIVKLYNCTMVVERAREDNSETTKLAKILGDTNSFWKVVYRTDIHKRFKRTTDNETSDANYYIGTGDSKADNTVADNTAYAESQDAYEDRLQQWRNQYLYWWNHYHGWANEHPISYKSLVSDWKGRRLRLATEFTPDAIATTKKMDPCEKCTVTKLPKKTTIQATQITEQLEIITPAPMTTNLLKKITTIPPTTPCIPEELGIATSALTTTPCKISELTTDPQKAITTIPARVIREQQKETTSNLTPSVPSVMTTIPPITTTIPPPIITEQLEITTPAPTTVPCIPCNKLKMTTEPPKILTTVPASIITEEQGKITPPPGTTPCNRSEITTDSQEKITTVPAPIVREQRGVATPMPTEPPSNPPIMTTKPPEKATTIPAPIVREERRVATPQPTAPPSNLPVMTTKSPEKVTTVPAPIVREERRVATPQLTAPPSNPPIRTTEAPTKVTTISPPIITEELGITTPAPATVPCTTCNKPEMTTGPSKQLTTVPATIIREKKGITTPAPTTIPCDKPDPEGKITTPCAMPEATAEVTTKTLVTDLVELIAECPKSEKNTPCSKTPIPTTKSPKDEDVTGRSRKDYHLAWERSRHPSPFHRILMYIPIQGRTALKDPNRLWDNCEIPWELSDKYSMYEKSFE